jgi:amidase
VLKANIDTGDEMVTSAGSLALAEHHAPDDAALVARLRQAGAVIIAKANLSEWANFRSTRSISGWSSLGGQTRNAYVLDRNPCGSSSGSAVAVAARLAPLAVGTETNGSIICPAATNGIVGIKPTVGLIEQDGIIPIAASQDTAGPMARTLAGAALLLDAMADPRTPVDSADLERGSLAGLRLGVIRDYPGATSSPPVEAAYEASLEILASAGAELVDPIELGIGERARDAELELLLFEFKDGIDRYLAASDAPLQNLRALIAFNEAHAETVMPWFDQEIFLMAATKPGLESAAYRQARADSIDSMRRSLDAVFAENDLDALIAPSNAGAWKIDIVHGDRFVVGSAAPAAISGYPSITIPGSLSDSLPLGLSFIGRAFEEAELLEIAAVFEARRGEFPAPTLIPSLESRTLFRE